MILVTGGIASGKRTYVRSLGYSDSQMSSRVADEASVLIGLEELLRAGDPSKSDLDALMAKDVVVCCEVGMGVVPMDARERAWRERVGRTCAVWARDATRVVRMVCGIPMVIKGER